jgi:cell division protein FtsN
MEQKKLLWIIFSVTLFLVVVVGAGFIWFYPGESPEYAERTEETESEGAQSEFDPIEWVRTSDEYPGLEEKKPSEEDDGFVVVYGENGEEQEASGEKPAEEQEKEAEARSAEAEEAAPSPGREDRESPAAQEKPKSVSKPAAPKKEAEPAQREKQYAGTKKTIRTVEYWIQAGSYTSKTRAERVQDRLDEKGFASRVETKEIDGTLYYRVRIGPYRNEGEADKFLTWVKDIKDFEKSYVSKVYRTKEVTR